MINFLLQERDILQLPESLRPQKQLRAVAKTKEGKTIEFGVIARLDSNIEIDYYQNGGILQYVLRQFLEKEKE